MGSSEAEIGLEVARLFNRATDDEWPSHFERLRRNLQLSAAVRGLNALLDQPDHRQEAISAFKRIGLWHEDADK